jgi:hypothetical protein
VISNSVLQYSDSFKNLADKVNTHEIIKWENERENDEVFMEKLVKPNSEYYSDNRPTCDRGNLKGRVK